MDSASTGELSPCVPTMDEPSPSPRPRSSLEASDVSPSPRHPPSSAADHAAAPQLQTPSWSSAQSAGAMHSLGDLATLPAAMPRSNIATPNERPLEESTDYLGASVTRAAAATESVHDDNFLQPHGLAVMGIGGMNPSPFVDVTTGVTHSVTSPSENSSMASADLPVNLGLPDCEPPQPPQPREQSALSAVLQSVASSQAEELRRQMSTVSWVPRDPSGLLGATSTDDAHEAVDALEAPAATRAPVPLHPVQEAPAELDSLRAAYRPARSAGAVSCFGHSTVAIRCSCRPAAMSTQAPAYDRHASTPWTSLSLPGAIADAASGVRRGAARRSAAHGLHPEQEGAMLQLCGATAAGYSVLYTPPGLPSALQALAHLLGLQRWVPGAAMETCPEEGSAGAAKVGSLFRSRSVRLQSASGSCSSVRPVVFYGVHDHELQGEFWSHVDCECVVIPDDAEGHPDLRILDAQLQRHSSARILLGTFCAACPVTGTMHDINALARILHRRGGLAVFDFSTAGASVASCHVPCATAPPPDAAADEDAGSEAGKPTPPLYPPRLDGILVAAGALADDHTAAFAVVFRTDSFPSPSAGPGPFRGTAQQGPFRAQPAACVAPMVEAPPRPSRSAVNRAARIAQRHISAGLREVSPLCHAYAEHALSVWRLCPGIFLLSQLSTDASAASLCTGTICFNIVVQQAAPRAADPSIGNTTHRTNDDSLTGCVPAARGGEEAAEKPDRSTNPYACVERALARGRSGEVDGGAPALLHHNFVAAVLSDLYGIQVHATHAPTGPFGESVVDKLELVIGEAKASVLRTALQAPGSFDSAAPYVPGWCEVHFSHLLTSAEVDYVTRSVVEVATSAWKLLPQYTMDATTGVFSHRSAATPAEQSTSAQTPPASTEAPAAAHKPSTSWPQSLGLRSEPSNIPTAVAADLSSTASSRLQRDTRASAPTTAVVPPPATEAPVLAEVPSGDTSDAEADIGGLSLLPISQVPSVLTEVTTVGSTHMRHPGVDDRGRAGARSAWRKVLACMCSNPDKSPGRRKELCAMNDAVVDSGSPDKPHKCESVDLPPLDDERIGGAARLCNNGSCADSVDLDTFQELQDGEAADADVASSSEDEGSEGGDTGAGPVDEDALHEDLRAAAAAAEGVYGGAAAAACAARDSGRSRASPAGDKRLASGSSGSIGLTAVLGESPASPRLLASFGYKHRQSRSRAQLCGPASGEFLPRGATGRVLGTQTSLRGSLGIGGLDSTASSGLNGGSKRWALRSMGAEVGREEGSSRGRGLAADCRRVFLQPRQSLAALEAAEDLGWMGHAAPLDEETAATTAAAAALLRAWLAGDVPTQPDEATSAAAHSDARTQAGSTLHLPAPPLQTLHPVPPLQLQGPPCGSASSQRRVTPIVPRLRLTSLDRGADGSGRLQHSSHLQESAARCQGTVQHLSACQGSTARPSLDPVSVPPPAPAASLHRPAVGAGAAAVSRVDSPAHSSPAPRVQRRLMFSTAFHDPAPRRPALHNSGRRSHGSADRRTFRGDDSGAPLRRASMAPMAEAAMASPARTASVDALRAARQVHPHGVGMQHAAAAESSRRHIWAKDLV